MNNKVKIQLIGLDGIIKREWKIPVEFDTKNENETVKLYECKCQYCGKTFTAKNRRLMYCSQNCTTYQKRLRVKTKVNTAMAHTSSYHLKRLGDFARKRRYCNWEVE